MNKLPLDDAEMARFFKPVEDLPPDGVFELGLVLGGTVSAGAYTAGVLDFLVEALDTWTAARDAGDPDAPPHSTILSVIAGTSGGGINGAITTRALRYAFPPVRLATSLADRARNPFHDTWVNRIGIRDFLDTADLASGLRAILNSRKLADIAEHVIGFVGDPRSPRPWLANPFRLFTTATNLRGIPYRISFQGATGLGHDLVSHADFMRFALTGIGAPTRQGVRPDEFALDHADAANWATLGASALATSAFPLAFEARPLRRPMEHLRYRVVATPGDAGLPAKLRPIVPTWSALADASGTLPEEYAFFSVDGGALNNEPIDIVRGFLAGMAGRNPRAGDAAKRALVLIDPFSDPETLDAACDPTTFAPGKTVSLLGEAGALINTWIYSSRFKPVDVALAQDPEIYSRFLVSPIGPGPAAGPDESGTKAMASGGLGGFLGFFHPDYVRYDFFLGRRNCQQFLRKYLALPPENPLIKTWNDHHRALHRAVVDGETLHPVIPLMGACRNDEQLPPWPAGKLDPNSLADAIGQRLGKILDAAESEAAPGNPVLRILFKGYLALGKDFAERELKALVIEKIGAALKEKRL
jgi:hypothetical protein